MKRVISIALIALLVLCGCSNDTYRCDFCGEKISAAAKYCSSCGKDLSVSCLACGAGQIAGANYCAQCGHKLSGEVTQSTDEQPTQAITVPTTLQAATEPPQTEIIVPPVQMDDGVIIECAINELVDCWAQITGDKLEIKNTRIIHLDPEQISALAGYSVSYIVEFLVYVNIWGIDEYYDEANFANNVIFYSDGSCEIGYDIVNSVVSNGNFSADGLTYTVNDYGTMYNGVWDLGSKTKLQDIQRNITDEEREIAEEARYLFLKYWHGLYSEGDWGERESRFEILNTRIVWVELDAGQGYPAECIVEFEIAIDYYGIPYYYAEPELNSYVVFYTNGKSAVQYGTLMYDGRTFEEILAVKDCGSAFNGIYDLCFMPNPPSIYQPIYDFDYYILDSGYCNNNIRWEIRSNGLLYVYGQGAVPNYDSYRDVPWRNSAVYELVTDIAFSDEISAVGDEALCGTYKTIHFGRNQIMLGWHGQHTIYADIVFISASMTIDAIVEFLEASCWTDYSESYLPKHNMTIYYEGTEELWEEIEKKLNKQYTKYDISGYTIYFECRY